MYFSFLFSQATTLRAQKKTCGTTVTKMEPLLSSVNSTRAFSRGDENPSKGTREKVRKSLCSTFKGITQQMLRVF